jgi:hypothetical protein
MKAEWFKYLFNGFWLIVPVLIWNAVFYSRLPAQLQPEIFDKNIPSFITYGENLLRIVVFGIPLLFTIEISTKSQQLGLGIFLTGAFVYFLSWVPLMVASESAWSTSLLGFMAPAYTPILWMVGIALLGNGFYFPVEYKQVYYLVPAAVFTVFHCTHVATVYFRNF